MVKINLLPWREYQKVYEGNVIKKIITNSLVLHIILSLCGLGFFAKINYALNSRILKLVISIKKEEKNTLGKSTQTYPDLNRGRGEMNALLAYRLTIAQLFDSLQNRYRSKLCFVEIKRAHDQWVLSGKSASLIDLLTFLNHWKSKIHFSATTISSLKKEVYGWQFSLAMQEKTSFPRKYLERFMQ